MTVALDNIAEWAAFSTVTPNSIEFTPTGTARGILVGISVFGSSTDRITGVTCEGVAMSRVDFAGTASGEPGGAYLYFLGTSIAAGALTIAISTDGGAQVKWASAVSVTAAADTEIVIFNKATSAAGADPQIALDTSAVSSLRMSITYSGHNAPTDLAELSGMEAAAAVAEIDNGASVAKLGRQTAAATGSFTIGYTATAEDYAIVAAAVQEVSGAAAADPYPYIGGGYYPTEG